jgi:pimeloyl-ACP methyl ester carboxylesterase
MEWASATVTPVRLEADGVVLAAERFGDDTGPGLLFTHGLGQTAGAWRQVARRFAVAGWTALAADARGHGASGRNPPHLPYSPELLVEDLRRWAATFPSPPVLVGASMGGLTGMVAQALHGCFSALVLVDITPRWEPEGVARILRFMRAHSDGFGSIEQAIDAIASYMPHRPRKSAQALSSLLVRDEDGRWRWHWDPRLVDDMNRDVDVRQQQLVEAARRIDVPTLLVTGGASDVVSRDTIDEFLALVPHAEHHLVADARHLVAGDDNDAFAGAVARFLAGLGIAGTISRPVAVEP